MFFACTTRFNATIYAPILSEIPFSSAVLLTSSKLLTSIFSKVREIHLGIFVYRCKVNEQTTNKDKCQSHPIHPEAKTQTQCPE